MYIANPYSTPLCRKDASRGIALLRLASCYAQGEGEGGRQGPWLDGRLGLQGYLPLSRSRSRSTDCSTDVSKDISIEGHGAQGGFREWYVRLSYG